MEGYWVLGWVFAEAAFRRYYFPPVGTGTFCIYRRGSLGWDDGMDSGYPKRRHLILSAAFFFWRLGWFFMIDRYPGTFLDADF